MRLLRFFILFSSFLSLTVHGQVLDFESIYQDHPTVPKGLIEAVAWSNTRMVHLDNPAPSCSGMPTPYGIMGLFENGANYFKTNGITVANLSGISLEEQKLDPNAQIRAYAMSYESILTELGLPTNDPLSVREVLHELSEIPDTGYVNFLAKEMQVYQILTFMNSDEFATEHNFQAYHFDLESIFGVENYKVLSSSKVKLTTTGIRSNDELSHFSITPDKSAQYGPAIWNPAPSCNFSTRNAPISAITIHTIQGNYAGAISWSQMCESNVSYHYVLRSSDGQVTQMVLEEDKAWHVGSENNYTIGYEHEGFVDNPVWYTEAMYNSSADLSRDIVNSGYGIPPLRTYFGPATVGINTLGGCTKIKGHQHYPNQTHTDPGVNWDWEKYYRLINNTYSPNLITSTNGVLYDSGGQVNDYNDDERTFWLIEPANAATISLDFTFFALETDYDYLFIYDGDSIDAPLIGMYTGINSPGFLSSTGGSLLIEFRSDCATTDGGWEVNYSATLNDVTPPVCTILTPSDWKTDDFAVQFSDSDTQSNVSEKYFLTAQNSLSPDDWYGVDSNVYELFSTDDSRWNAVTGSFQINSGAYLFNDINEQNSNTYINAVQDAMHTYLYTWDQTFLSSENNQRAGVHFFCSNATLPNRGDSYFIYLRENDDLVHIYRVENDVFSLVHSTGLPIAINTNYNVKVSYSPFSGLIKVYIDDTFLTQWQDSSPLQSGNSISLRTGGCSAQFDNLMMLRSRSNSIVIPVGPTEEVANQSTAGQSTVKVVACVIDEANNCSSLSSEYYLIDYTTPLISWLHDGSSQDIDTFYTSILEGNWEAYDPHSGIASYEFAVGTLPNLNDVIDWTMVNLNQSIIENLSNPVFNQLYYISLRATNGASLNNLFLSDGQRYMEGLGLSDNSLESIGVYPNPTQNFILLQNIDQELNYVLYDEIGRIILTGKTKDKIDVQSLSSGNYQLLLRNDNTFIIRQIIKQ